MPSNVRLPRGPWTAVVTGVALLFAAAPASVAAWTGARDLSVSDQESTEPQVAVNEAGRSVFIWEQLFSGTDSLIQARARSANGNLGPIIDVSSLGVNPQVAIAPDGDALLIYIGTDGTNRLVLARTLSATGELGPVEPISPSGENATEQAAPQLGMDRDGDAVVTWSTDDLAVRARSRAADGTLGPTQNLSAAGQPALFPEVAVAPGGASHLTWLVDDGGIVRVQARSRSAGGNLGKIKYLSTAGQDALSPDVAMDDGGNAFFAWRETDGANNRIAMRARPAGGSYGPVTPLSAAGEDADEPEVAADPAGNVLFVWQRFDGAIDDGVEHCCRRVQIRARSAAGDLSATRTISPSGLDATGPQVAFDRNGNAVLAWDRRALDGFRVDAITRSANGRLGQLETVSPGNWSLTPRVGVDGDGDASLVWSRRASSAQARIQASFGP